MTIMDKINDCRYHQALTDNEARKWCGTKFERLPRRGAVHVRVPHKMLSTEYLWRQGNGKLTLSTN